MANTTQRRSSVRKYTVLALVVFAIIAVIGGTYSRYSSTGNANATAEVAKWAVKLNGTNISSATGTVTPELTYADNSNVAAGKLAPGRSATFNIELDPTGSEVAIDYTLEIKALTGITNSSSTIAVTGATYVIGTGNPATATITNGTISIPETLADVQANKKVTVTVTVTWTNGDDAADTDNGVKADPITVPVTVKAQQHI